MSNQRYVFDFARNATEVYSYLVMYVLPENHEHDKVAFIKGLENLLYEHATMVIELNVNKLIRVSRNVLDVDPYLSFSMAFNVDQIALENAVDGMASFKYVTNLINTIMGSETFIIWHLTPTNGVYIFESFGDFRINEWMADHVINGRYKP